MQSERAIGQIRVANYAYPSLFIVLGFIANLANIIQLESALQLTWPNNSPSERHFTLSLSACLSISLLLATPAANKWPLDLDLSLDTTDLSLSSAFLDD